jgi:hypothetical protein
MGKAARNEQIKIRATYYNNSAVGLFIAGVLLPILAFHPQLVALATWFSEYTNGRAEVDKKTVVLTLATIIAAATAFATSVIMHHHAIAELSKIED